MKSPIRSIPVIVILSLVVLITSCTTRILPLSAIPASSYPDNNLNQNNKKRTATLGSTLRTSTSKPTLSIAEKTKTSPSISLPSEGTLTPLPTFTYPQNESGQLSAFPGAEGFGTDTIGGRGGKIIRVTNLNDSGPGSLRSAIQTKTPRIVVFTIGGTIELKSGLEIDFPYITIAGQTAPGGGITLKNLPSTHDSALTIRTHDVVVRYIRSRPGPTDKPVSNGDALEILDSSAYNIVIDHCSFSWAVDENVSTWYAAHDITIQWSIISEGLYCSSHAKGCHSMGLMLGSDGSRNISVHHNLLAHNHERNPYVKTVGLVDLVNNVFYNPWGTPIVLTDTFGKVTANIINNYFLPGADTEPGKFMVNVTSETNFGIEIYVQGNRSPQQPDETTGDQYAVKPEARIWIVPSQFEAPYITTTSAAAALEQILSSAGAAYGVDQQGYFYWRRDPVDEQVVKDVRNGTGRIINDPSEVGGWPTLSAGIPLVDSDQDGMPDAWELRFGFNPKDPADGNADANGNGYSNVEEYLNGTNPNQ